MLAARLRKTAVISIGHRSTLVAMHRRFLVLTLDGASHRLVERAASEMRATPAPAG
jgi:putative ATP-binding cassette transporter